MNAVEFTTELSGAAVLPIPVEVAAQLPKTGMARIIVLTDEHSDDADWCAGAYEQFLRDDSQEDAIYESEIAQRIARYKAGESKPVPAEEVFARLRQIAPDR